jgi:hypothetical protein
LILLNKFMEPAALSGRRRQRKCRAAADFAGLFTHH